MKIFDIFKYPPTDIYAVIFPIFAFMIYLIGLIVIACTTVWYSLNKDGFKVPPDFGCGTDEICICEKAEDCIRKK